MCFGGGRSAPMQPAPVPPPPPMKKVKKVESPSLAKRQKSRRRGGSKSLVINRTLPKLGAQGAGARAV